MSSAYDNDLYQSVALIGIGCRYPGGINGPEDFWQVLANGIDCITETPPSRWDTYRFYRSNKEIPGTLLQKWGGYIDGADEFDPAFFGITPREAVYMDPQQRKLLEVTWEALEDGGQKPAALAGEAVGVFIGAFTADYKIIQFSGNYHDNLAAHTSTGVMMTMVSNRISYAFDFKGPSLSIDTACSSSLVAVHLACESLRTGESNLAIAGGTLLQFAPQYTIAESKGGFLSPTGTSHAFDASANGYVRAEGVGVVLLKRLRDAIRDNDPIYAVIIADGANQDGHSNGITVPDGSAQQTLIKTVCRKAGIEPGALQYVEAHGTGTPVGDPIEANALGEVLKIGRKAGEQCYIGSVKTNFGHAESAAGVAGLIKAALSLRHKQIPPHLHLKSLNEKITIEQWPYQIPTALVPWPESAGPARAGVNSFGFGGTNAHVVLQEAPARNSRQNDYPTERPRTARPSILPLTARDSDQYAALAEKYCDFISSPARSASLTDIGYTLSQRREHLGQRLAIVYRERDDLCEQLSLVAANETGPLIFKGTALANEKRKLVWVFTGMGAQWWAMGRELYATEPVFRDTIDRCDRAISELTGWSLVREMIEVPEERSKMTETWISQPANFAIQVSLAALWRTLGIVPDAIVGHSTGEAAAFHEAGVYPLEEAIRIIVHRSRLQQKISGAGKMVAVGLSKDEIAPMILPYGRLISIAAVNSNRSVTLSGDESALQDFVKPLIEKGVFCKFLVVQIPFHSAYMDPIKEELLQVLSDLCPRPATIPLYSTALGAKVDGAELDNQYWWKNVRGSVLFADAVNRILDDGYSVFLEIGPHPVLGASISECMDDRQMKGKQLFSLKRKENEQQRIATVAAELFILGFEPNWDAFYGEGSYTRLPSYPWKKERFWSEPQDFQTKRLGFRDHPLLGMRLVAPEPSWEESIDTGSLTYLRDHQIQSNVVFPAAGYIEMALFAAKTIFGSGNFIVEDFEIRKALFLPEGQNPKVRFVLSLENNSFKVTTLDIEHNTSISHAAGRLSLKQPAVIAPPIDIDALKSRLQSSLSSAELYEQLAALGYEYQHCFQAIDRIWLGIGESLASVEMKSEIAADAADYFFHPTITDSFFQTLIAAEFARTDSGAASAIRLPVAISRICLPVGHTDRVWAHSRITREEQGKLIGDILIYDTEGRCIGAIRGFVAQSVDLAVGAISVNTIDHWLYELEWQEKSLPTQEPAASANHADAWLILADHHGLGAEIARIVNEKRGTCCIVQSGDEYFLSADSRTATVAPESPDQMRALLSAVANNNKHGIKGIVHLWNLDALASDGEIAIDHISAMEKSGTYSVIALAQAVLDLGIASKLWVVTRGGQSVTSDQQAISLAAAPAWGVGRVLSQQELTENWGGMIDLDPQDHGSLLSDEAASILNEILSEDPDGFSAYRNSVRYVQRIVPTSRLSQPLPARFQANGCYLITGAFGALGQLVGRFMATRGARRLILAARTAIPARSEWHAIAPQSATGEKLRYIQDLESLGCAVIVANLDVSNEKQVADYFSTFKRLGYPPICGVVHSAGTVEDRLLPQMNHETFAKVYAPKVYGSLLLHKYLSDQPIEMFVLFSSVAALITTAGQTNYAAGNAFLDALAHLRRSRGLPALSINWGPWAVGMIDKLGLIEHYRQYRGMNSTVPAVGINIFDRVMGQDVPQILACEADWRRVLAWYHRAPSLFAHLAEADESAPEEGKQSFISAFRDTAVGAKVTLVQDHLADVIAEVLRCKRAQVDANSTLNMLGLDSIMSTELRNKIATYFGQTLTIVRLLSSATVAQLAEELTMAISAAAADDKPEGGGSGSTEADSHSSDSSTASRAGDIESEYPLSYGQKAIWFITQLIPDSVAYNIAGAMHIPATIDLDALHQSIRETIKRHPCLRTNFFINDGEPWQRVYTSGNDSFKLVDAIGKEWKEILAMIVDENAQPFNLENDPLYRVSVYRQGEESYYFAVCIHHIVSDAASNYMLLDHIQAFYAHFAHGKPLAIAPLSANYKDFVDWESRVVNSSKGSRMFKYWKNNLPENIPVLDLPLDKTRPVLQTTNGASYVFCLSAKLSDQIKELSHSSGATVFMVLLSAFYTLLHKYTSQQDIVVGTPVSGRTQEQFFHVYGYFINIMPLWVSFSGNPRFCDFLKLVQDKVLLGLENQEFPFSLMVDRLGVEHDPSRSAVFQAMFVYLVHRVARAGIDANDVAQYSGFPMRLLDLPEEEGQFDLTLSMYEQNGIFHATFKYNTDLFFESTLSRMAKHFATLLDSIALNPEKRVSEHCVLSPEEWKQLVGDWSGNKRLTPEKACFHNLIESRAEAQPDAVAICVPSEVGDTAVLTYRQLDRKANQLAHHLRSLGVTPNTAIGVCMDKSTDMIVCLLGVLKSGGAYVPIDPLYPTERIAYMLDNSSASIVVADSQSTATLPSDAHKVIVIDQEWAEIAKHSDSAPMSVSTPDHLCYVIYTSGSTGRPKGVCVTHRNLVSIYRAWEKEYDLPHAARTHLQMASFSFDVFTGDLARALCSGGKLVLCRKEILLNIPFLYRVMVEQEVDCAEFVPAILRQLMLFMRTAGKQLDFMRLLLVGSDTWTVKELEDLKSYSGLSTRVINTYGLTEATIDSTFFEGDSRHLRPSSTVPIGRPFDNTSIYVLDQFLNPVPIGISGEIYIGGEGVAQGYLNNPELTRERFIAHAFEGYTPSRLYKTGDLGRWDESGNLQILQRLDTQVKIRGYRIETGEIEQQLLSFPGITEAVVTIGADAAGTKEIHAYYVAAPDRNYASKAIMAHLRERLPHFMVPAHLMAIDAVPVTPNGKVDVKALPKPSAAETPLRLVEPMTLFERKTADVWVRLLGVEPSSLGQDFFGLGGNSLHLIELMIALQEEFRVKLTVTQLFKDATLHGMAAFIEDIVTGKEAGADPYLVYNASRQKTVFCFPPAGGYSIVYQPLAENMPDVALVSFNYLTEADKVSRYANWIDHYPTRAGIALFGYSIGGNLAFEVCKELERRGRQVDDLVIMDSYRITGDFKPSAEDLRKFEHELAEHLERHTGSNVVKDHVLKQANDFIEFSYRVKNHGTVNAAVHFIIEDNPEDIHGAERRASWNGSSASHTHVHRGIGKHADMLDKSCIAENARIVRRIIDGT